MCKHVNSYFHSVTWEFKAVTKWGKTEREKWRNQTLSFQKPRPREWVVTFPLVLKTPAITTPLYILVEFTVTVEEENYTFIKSSQEGKNNEIFICLCAAQI